MQEYKFIVEKEAEGCRLDHYIVGKLGKQFSRSFIKDVIQDGAVFVNDQNLKPHHTVKKDDSIRIIIPPAKEIKIDPEAIPLDIVFEDDDLLVINKSSGLVVHPAAGNYSGTLVNALLSHTKSLSSIDPGRPGIVHRLDKDTSGLLVVAKNNESHISLSKQFQRHTIFRKYIALVKGRVEFDEDSIDLPLVKDKKDFRRIKVGFTGGKKAITKYRVLKRSKKYSFLEIYPQTGRTHQIRVHLAFKGHPILGDLKYGKTGDFSRLALHALDLSFRHPRTDKIMSFSSSIPKEFGALIKGLQSDQV